MGVYAVHVAMGGEHMRDLKAWMCNAMQAAMAQVRLRNRCMLLCRCVQRMHTFVSTRGERCLCDKEKWYGVFVCGGKIGMRGVRVWGKMVQGVSLCQEKNGAGINLCERERSSAPVILKADCLWIGAWKAALSMKRLYVLICMTRLRVLHQGAWVSTKEVTLGACCSCRFFSMPKELSMTRVQYGHAVLRVTVTFFAKNVT